MHNSHNATYHRQARRPASVCRAAAYERPYYDSARPEEFFDSRVKLAAVCPETALMYAVLEDAFLCFQKQFEMEGQLNLQARQAEQWFFCNDSNWLFSFVSVCDVLGLEPQYIRTKLKHWTPSRLDPAPTTR